MFGDAYDWYEKSRTKQYGNNAFAYQEYIIDFDEYYEFDNDIRIISSDTKRDPRLLEQVPDDTFKNKYGEEVEIYYLTNNSSKIEFFFISESYSHFYGQLRISRKTYKEFSSEIADFLFKISDYERDIKKGYKQLLIEDEGIKYIITYPEYWEGILHTTGRIALFQFDYSDETYMNDFSI